MKYGWVLFTFLITFYSFSKEISFELQEWRMKSEVKTFAYIKSKSLLISINCVYEANKSLKIKPHCLNELNKIEKEITKLKPKDLKNGKNPGAVACDKIMSGVVRFAYNIKGDQKTFCQLSKNIFIENKWIAKTYVQSKK